MCRPLRKAGLHDRDLHFHDLRGTAATNFYKAKLSIREITGILGWREDRVERIIDRYVKRDEILRDRVRRMEEAEKRTKTVKKGCKKWGLQSAKPSSGRRESNPRHTAWEAVVLPLNYARVPHSLAWSRGSHPQFLYGRVGADGIERTRDAALIVALAELRGSGGCAEDAEKSELRRSQRCIKGTACPSSFGGPVHQTKVSFPRKRDPEVSRAIRQFATKRGIDPYSDAANVIGPVERL